MGIISKFIDFFLYSNIWIAGSAAALCVYTQYVLCDLFVLDHRALFLFTTCTWLYSLHRYIGLQKVKAINKEDRFFKIKQLQRTIFIIGGISFIISSILIFYLTWLEIFVLILPGILSMLYVLPIFKGGTRLRDMDYIKVYTIALVWGGLSVLFGAAGPAGCFQSSILFTIFIERCLFIFAITLPFDIRDLKIDKLINVKTIPAKIGIPKTKVLCFLLLTICSLLLTGLYFYGLLPLNILGIHLLTNILTILIILLAIHKKHDWYYTGLLDGTMYFPLLFLCFSLLFS